MDSKTFEQIKQKIEALKTKKAKAEGTIETLLSTLKEVHGVDSIEEAETKAESMEEEIALFDSKLEGLYAELTEVTDWNKI